jgi:hypothetical protein
MASICAWPESKPTMVRPWTPLSCTPAMTPTAEPSFEA